MHRALHSTTAARGGGCLLWLGRSGVWIHAAPRGSTEPWSLLMTRRSWCNTHAWVRVAHPVGRAWSFPRNTCRAGGGGRGGRGQFVAHVRVRVHWTQWPRGRGNRTRSTTVQYPTCTLWSVSARALACARGWSRTVLPCINHPRLHASARALTDPSIHVQQPSRGDQHKSRGHRPLHTIY